MPTSPPEACPGHPSPIPEAPRGRPVLHGVSSFVPVVLGGILAASTAGSGVAASAPAGSGVAASAPGGSGVAASDPAGEPRVLEVTLLVDGSFRKLSNWSRLAQRIVEQGTEDLDELAGLRLRVVDTVEWEPPPQAESLEATFRGAVGTDGVGERFVVAFLGKGPESECPQRCGYAYAGRPGLLVVFNDPANFQYQFSLRDQMTTDFRRELGHVFGVPQAISIVLEDPIPRAGRNEDQESVLELLLATRAMRFETRAIFSGCDRVRLREVYSLLAERGKMEPALLVNLGVACFREGEFAEAREMHAQALALQPGLVEAELGLAQSALALGDSAFVRIHADSLAARPLDADKMGLLGILRVRLGDWELAEPLLTEAMTAHPDRFTFVFNRGLARFHQGQYGPAALDFERALALEERPEAWLNLGLTRDALGEREAAIRAFSRCLEREPGEAIRREAERFLEHLRR